MSVTFLPHIERMTGYVPGEQPRGGPITKLNTNEKPVPALAARPPRPSRPPWPTD